MIKRALFFLKEIINYLLNHLHSLFKKKVSEKYTMLETIKNVLIIDDRREEVEPLEKVLIKQDIGVLHLTPEDALQETLVLKPKELLFLDFMLDDAETVFKTILSNKIRPILRKHFNKKSPYGIVIWSKHEEYCDVFFEKMKNDLETHDYDAPLFIIRLDKLKYLEKNDYSDLLTDMQNELEHSTSASFFLNWQKGVIKGFNKTVKDIYSLCNSFGNRDEKIKHILYRISQAYSGISKENEPQYIANNCMTKDAYKAFNEIFFSDINSENVEYENIFETYSDHEDSFENEVKLAAIINQKKFLNQPTSEQNFILPGNVYKICNDNKLLVLKGLPANSIPIAIELTPPCDAANKKTFSRLVGGFLLEYPSNKKDWGRYFDGNINYKYIKNKDGSKTVDEQRTKYIRPLFKKPSQYVLGPVYIPVPGLVQTSYMLLFDFAYRMAETDSNLIDKSKYDLLFKVKESLFADILQKYSSHGARLGISSISI